MSNLWTFSPSDAGWCLNERTKQLERNIEYNTLIYTSYYNDTETKLVKIVLNRTRN